MTNCIHASPCRRPWTFSNLSERFGFNFSVFGQFGGFERIERINLVEHSILQSLDRSFARPLLQEDGTCGGSNGEVEGWSGFSDNECQRRSRRMELGCRIHKVGTLFRYTNQSLSFATESCHGNNGRIEPNGAQKGSKRMSYGVKIRNWRGCEDPFRRFCHPPGCT